MKKSSVVLSEKKRGGHRKSKWSECMVGQAYECLPNEDYQPGKEDSLIQGAVQWGRNQLPKLRVLSEKVKEGDTITMVRIQFELSKIIDSQQTNEEKSQEATV